MIASKTFKLSAFHLETGTEISFKKVDVIVLDDSVYGDDGFDLLDSTKRKQNSDSGEVALDDAKTGAMVGNPTQYVDDGIFDAKVAALVDESDVKSGVNHSVKITADVNDPQLHSKDFSVHDTPTFPSVVSNVQKMRNICGMTIVEDKQVVDRPCKIQKVHLTSSNSEPVLHFTTQVEHRLLSFCSPYFHMPSDVSSALDLHTDNLKPVKIQNLKGEVQELFTRF
ncbi:hypothetical protein Hanom_Chr05g00437031 [Helianthus anomalus]